MDYIVHGILQARIQELVAFSFSRGSSELRSFASQADSLSAKPQRKPMCIKGAEFNRKKGSPVKMKMSPEDIKTQLHKIAWSKPSKCTPSLTLRLPF